MGADEHPGCRHLAEHCVEVVVLRSEPAPLTRKADAAEPEAAEPPPVEPEAPVESADVPATKSRRRRKAAA